MNGVRTVVDANFYFIETTLHFIIEIGIQTRRPILA